MPDEPAGQIVQGVPAPAGQGAPQAALDEDPAVAQAKAAVAAAQTAVKATDQKVKFSLFESVPKVVLSGFVVGVWALAILIWIIWTWKNNPGKNAYVCNTPPPPATTVAGASAALGTDCTNGWVSTTAVFKDILVTGVIPFLTLVLGFYFGRQSATDGQG